MIADALSPERVAVLLAYTSERLEELKSGTQHGAQDSARDQAATILALIAERHKSSDEVDRLRNNVAVLRAERKNLRRLGNNLAHQAHRTANLFWRTEGDPELTKHGQSMEKAIDAWRAHL